MGTLVAMAEFTSTATDAALTALNGATSISLHSADPAGTGANEISGGSYARQTITWGTASGGSMSNTNVITFSVPASTTVAYFGVWNGTTYEYGGSLNSSQTFSTAGTYQIAAGGLTVTAAG